MGPQAEKDRPGEKDQGIRLVTLIPAFLTRLWARMKRLFSPHPVAVAVVPAPPLALAPPDPPVLAEPLLVEQLEPPAETAVLEPAKPRGNRGETQSLKRDILENLESYQVYIKRLKKWYPDAYAQYRRVGAFICNDGWEADTRAIEPSGLAKLPGFGAVALGIGRISEPTSKNVPVRFITFQKMKRLGADVQQVKSGVAYRCHIYWDDAEDKIIARRGTGIGQDFVVVVEPDGSVRALRMLSSQPQTIRHRRNGGGDRSSVIHHKRWSIPLDDWSRKEDEEQRAARVATMFICCLNFWLTAAHHSMIRITATKSDIVMPFVVDATATPAFFSDRDPIVVNGVKKRIFHVVRAHVRRTSQGPKGIKLHFAGLRAFTWNGYQVAITVPGRDHLDIADLTVGAAEYDEGEALPDDHTMTVTEMADWVADKIGSPGKREAKC